MLLIQQKSTTLFLFFEHENTNLCMYCTCGTVSVHDARTAAANKTKQPTIPWSRMDLVQVVWGSTWIHLNWCCPMLPRKPSPALDYCIAPVLCANHHWLCISSDQRERDAAIHPFPFLWIEFYEKKKTK